MEKCFSNNNFLKIMEQRKFLSTHSARNVYEQVLDMRMSVSVKCNLVAVICAFSIRSHTLYLLFLHAFSLSSLISIHS